MIVTIPVDESSYFTAPPFAEVPITVHIQDPDDIARWIGFGAIKHAGHAVRLFGDATYRFSTGKPGPDCCVEYTEVEVVDATPRINVESI